MHLALLFSEPRLDLNLILKGQTSAIDLPQKFLVWQDESGVIRLAYNAAGYIQERHDLLIRDGVLFDLNETLKQFGRVPTGLVNLDSGLIDVMSADSVEESVDALEVELLDRGFIVPLIVDYRARAKAENRELRPTTLIIFGNPAIGTQLMQEAQSVGLDLPQTMLVWEDAQGQVHIGYNDPYYIARRHGVQQLDSLLETIASVLGEVARMRGGS